MSKKENIDKPLKDEPLHNYVKRIAIRYNVSDDVLQAMKEISKWSYIEGVKSASKILINQ